MSSDAHPNIVTKTWPEPVVITAFAGALDGNVELLEPAFEERIVRSPFDRRNLPPTTDRALGALSLTMAVGRALEDPALGSPPPPEGRAIVVGTRVAALNETVHFMERVAIDGPRLVNPGLFPFTVMNAAAGLAAIVHECTGANITLNNGATSSVDAIACAADLVAAGREQVVFAGGFEGMGELASRALDRKNPPATMATILVVSTLRDALARGAQPVCEIVSVASGELVGAEPGEAPHEEILRVAMEAATRQAPGSVLAAQQICIGSEPQHEEVPFGLLSVTMYSAQSKREHLTALYAGSEVRPTGAALLLRPADGAS